MDKSDSVREADKGGRKKLRGNGEAWRMSFTDAMPSSPVTMVTGPYICVFFFFLKFSSVKGTNSEPLKFGADVLAQVLMCSSEAAKVQLHHHLPSRPRRA